MDFAGTPGLTIIRYEMLASPATGAASRRKLNESLL
jgi:hypothetical protein